MAAATLDEVQRLVDQLSPIDQAHLLEYLAPRITSAMASAHPAETSADDTNARRAADAQAWQRLLRIGDEIARTTPPGAESMTAAVTAMRR
jgi:hypothetical protein